MTGGEWLAFAVGLVTGGLAVGLYLAGLWDEHGPADAISRARQPLDQAQVEQDQAPSWAEALKASGLECADGFGNLPATAPVEEDD